MKKGGAMLKNKYGRYYFITILSLWAVMMFAPSSIAKSPAIIRYDAHLMEKDVRINLAWQSEEPVVKIIASAGKEQITITDNIENERNDRGYSGEIDVVVPAYFHNYENEQTLSRSRESTSTPDRQSTKTYANFVSAQNEVIEYSIQIVDEVNQRSSLIKDKVRRIEPNSAVGMSRTQPKTTAESVRVDVKDPVSSVLNTTIGLVGSLGQTVEIKNVTINKWSENRVSISFEATGSKAINSVSIEVKNAQGEIVYQSSPISCNSEKQCAKQTDPFFLNPGNYVASVVATDTENNNLKKIEKEFQFAGTN